MLSRLWYKPRRDCPRPLPRLRIEAHAAENAGRLCCGIELDPLYVDVIIRRYEAETGAAAILADTGETFEPIATRKP